MKKTYRKIDSFKRFKGWVEIENGEIVIGNFGIKVYKRKNRILNEGFTVNEIGKVEVKIINTYE